MFWVDPPCFLLALHQIREPTVVICVCIKHEVCRWLLLWQGHPPSTLLKVGCTAACIHLKGPCKDFQLCQRLSSEVADAHNRTSNLPHLARLPAGAMPKISQLPAWHFFGTALACAQAIPTEASFLARVLLNHNHLSFSLAAESAAQFPALPTSTRSRLQAS